MNIEFEELQVESLMEIFVKKIEELIISGKIKIGEQLPAEREIASQMGISRTIVHSGLIELAVKGFITIQPRRGTVVNDYRTCGTLAVLNSLMNYSEGQIDEKLLNSIISTRYLIEVENARLAALNRSEEDLLILKKIIDYENLKGRKDLKNVTDSDFNFHHTISMATGNMIYPLIIKSFEPIYKNLTSNFFSDLTVLPVVFDFHKKLYVAIENKASKEAVNIMQKTLKHGEICIRKMKINHENWTKFWG